jgi:two-component system, LytTR family, sensor kinase
MLRTGTAKTRYDAVVIDRAVWKRRLVAILVVIACVPLLALVEAGLDYLPTLVGQGQHRFLWTLGHMMFPWAELALLAPFVLHLARRLPLGGAHPVRGALLHLAASVVFGTTHLFLVVLVDRVTSGQALPLLGLTVQLISRYMLQDVFLYWTLVGGVQLLRHRRTQARLSADLAEARLAALEARLEPHFLFNTLNTAVMLVRGDRRDQAVDVLVELSELLRLILERAPRHLVPLETEWTFISRFLALEQARFAERLSVRLHREPGLERQPVPFLVLQPLVENALRHGIGRRTATGPGHLTVTARVDEPARLRLEVRDDGPGPESLLPARPGRPGLGLTNVRARLRELYGERADLQVGPAPGGGTLASITLPLEAAGA